MLFWKKKHYSKVYLKEKVNVQVDYKSKIIGFSSLIVWVRAVYKIKKSRFEKNLCKAEIFFKLRKSIE